MYPNFNYKSRFRLFSGDGLAKAFFGGNALVSLVVLGLITLFLFREGAGFFGMNRENLSDYRRSGSEFVDTLRCEETSHFALVRELNAMRADMFRFLTEKENFSASAAGECLTAFDKFSEKFGDAGDGVRALVAESEERATAFKAELAQTPASFDLSAKQEVLRDLLPRVREVNRTLDAAYAEAAETLPAPPVPGFEKRAARFKQNVIAASENLAATGGALTAWDGVKPVSGSASVTSFLFGREWVTASFWQDWYGILPLLAGSLLVSAIALAIAVPLGVAAAVYVSQIATPVEKRFIKPAIEFIAAFPSVVLGFFGIVVLGELLREVSGFEWLRGLPGLPIVERLNALNAGCLLAFISIPLIFSIAEDALTNVPRALREASFSLGASRVQTIVKVVIPAAFPGIAAAVLLGFGRVLGETMIVLLCAGNRIAIPDFSAGPAVVTQPVHTMTGIIAQEMGEVVQGSIHYRALFAVGIVLFMLSLFINFGAQKIVARYRAAVS